MAVTGLNHVSVTVADMEEALAFYGGLLGLELRGRGEVAYEHLDEIIGLGPTRIEWAELHLPGGQLLELFRYARPAGTPVSARTSDPGATHVCLEVDDADALFARLTAAGVPTRSARPVTIPFGDWEGWSCFYAVDPDGVTVELVQRPGRPPARAEDPQA